MISLLGVRLSLLRRAESLVRSSGVGVTDKYLISIGLDWGFGLVILDLFLNLLGFDFLGEVWGCDDPSNRERSSGSRVVFGKLMSSKS